MQIFTKKTAFILWFSALLLNIIALGLTYYYLPEAGKVVLKYDVEVGALAYGNERDLFSLPMFSFFLLAFNTVVYLAIRRFQNTLAQLAIISSLLVAVIFFGNTILLLIFNK